MVEEVRCYNRGCGKTFFPDPEEELKEGEGPCQFHPGAPYFHDAYKGWSCCGKKATDFTEFLNFPGCTRGSHSRVKPVEPEKITGNLSKLPDEPEPKEQTRAPISTLSALKRPPFDSDLTRVKATVTKSLRDQLELNPFQKSKGESNDESEQGVVKSGEPCKNSGCKATFVDASSNAESCQFHPGAPIFHEGMKFWSCCQRKTSDFQSFLDQVGCQEGFHCWVKKVDGADKSVTCRYDWHQTATHVTVAVYAKKYDPDSSFVEINPIRLKIHLFFPEQGGSFDVDLELKGIIDVAKSTVNMAASKVEIQMLKAEPGSWSALNFPPKQLQKKPTLETQVEVPKVDALDLDDLQLGAGAKFTLSPEASVKN